MKPSRGHEGSTFMNGSVSLEWGWVCHKSQFGPLFYFLKHEMPSTMLWRSKKAITRCWSLGLGLPSLSNCKLNKFLVITNYPVCGFCDSSIKQIKAFTETNFTFSFYLKQIYIFNVATRKRSYMWLAFVVCVIFLSDSAILDRQLWFYRTGSVNWLYSLLKVNWFSPILFLDCTVLWATQRSWRSPLTTSIL